MGLYTSSGFMTDQWVRSVSVLFWTLCWAVKQAFDLLMYEWEPVKWGTLMAGVCQILFISVFPRALPFLLAWGCRPLILYKFGLLKAQRRRGQYRQERLQLFLWWVGHVTTVIATFAHALYWIQFKENTETALIFHQLALFGGMHSSGIAAVMDTKNIHLRERRLTRQPDISRARPLFYRPLFYRLLFYRLYCTVFTQTLGTLSFSLLGLTIDGSSIGSDEVLYDSCIFGFGASLHSLYSRYQIIFRRPSN